MPNVQRRPRRTVVPGVLALTAALMLPTTATAQAGTGPAGTSASSAEETAPLPALIEGSGAAIHPEGVAWDPTRSAFLIGSIRYGTVSVVRADGVPRTLIDDPELIATGAIRVDVARNRLLVTYDDVYAGPGALLSVGSTAETAGRHAGLAIYDLRTGRLQKRIDLGEAPGWHLANDIALDPAGNAYVTDSFSGHIFKVTPSGAKSTFLYAPALDAGITDNLPNVGLNGIVYHPDGYLLAVRYDTGAIFRIPLDHPDRFSEVTLQDHVPGADGMALTADGTLYAATNTIRSNGIDGLFRLRSADGWKTAYTVSKEASPEAAPTTVAVTPYGDYVLSSNLNVLFGSGGTQTRDGLVLRRY
ncbi:SMP-30/gluconolactonase/LRE family protein [Streptomyces sp. DSM 40750]|uniref:SMP-30/gluconolactonase/LRE family protein n=1 Tax=Streptomyces sp. DSM 40750 TaxID=2801030 RepID=UPI00214C53B7|nr:SMP-30/gluconolactonase/LRE family protein [Streptomyces sp. DSM 40750]UUU22364.1 SMP-30/gluconolactonase/LRE family protein [Streptomyces sp. DSM 40750]